MEAAARSRCGEDAVGLVRAGDPAGPEEHSGLTRDDEQANVRSYVAWRRRWNWERLLSLRPSHMRAELSPEDDE